MQFADFKTGLTFACGSRLVSEEEVIEFARRYDPQWFHSDATRAAAGRWHGLIASGWLTCCIAMELAVRHLLADSESFGSPGLENLQWEHPVRPGDELRLSVAVIEARKSASHRTGTVRWRWELYNQQNIRVLNLTTVSLFDLTAPPEPTGGNSAQ